MKKFLNKFFGFVIQNLKIQLFLNWFEFSFEIFWKPIFEWFL